MLDHAYERTYGRREMVYAGLEMSQCAVMYGDAKNVERFSTFQHGRPKKLKPQQIYLTRKLRIIWCR